MKNTTKSLIAIAAAAGVAAIALSAPSIAEHRGGGMGKGHHHGRMLFQQFDANKDGSVTKAEVQQVQDGRLNEYDANGDGELTLEEYAALWAAVRRDRMVDQFQRLDNDGDAIVTEAEMKAPLENMIVALDGDGDGAVTRTELKERRHGKGRHHN